MLDVFFTVDVEVWCDGWANLDEQFPSWYRKYIYGETRSGDFGLPYKVAVLSDHGLPGVFFVEPLFATRFGHQALAEIVGLLNPGNHEVQLHLHTEWVDEAIEPVLSSVGPKRQHLKLFSLEEQTALIAVGLDLLKKVGVHNVNAFRAGSFAFNAETLRALAVNKIPFDTSYNASMFGSTSGVLPGITVVEPILFNGVFEYPMTVFNDGTRSLRPVQLTACSSKEMESLLWQALERGSKSFVILSHGSELLNQRLDRPDPIVVSRFRRLCAFLEKHRDVFNVRGFQGLTPNIVTTQPVCLNSPIWCTGARLMQQVYRKIYR